jgi:hypothetical protein
MEQQKLSVSEVEAKPEGGFQAVVSVSETL